MGADETKYSKRIEGDRGNHRQAARFDLTGRRYLGITQFDGDRICDRVLLSPEQVESLLAFIGRK